MNVLFVSMSASCWVCVDILDIHRWVLVDAVIEPFPNSLFESLKGVWASSLVYRFKTASLSSKMYNVVCLLKSCALGGM